MTFSAINARSLSAFPAERDIEGRFARRVEISIESKPLGRAAPVHDPLLDFNWLDPMARARRDGLTPDQKTRRWTSPANQKSGI